MFRNWERLPFEMPPGATLRFGADWGFSVDPTVLVRCFIGRWAGQAGASEVIADPQGRCLFVDHEAYQVGCAIDDTPALFAGSDIRRPLRWANVQGHRGIPLAGTTKITADSARPETIDYLKRKGFEIEAAIKGPGSLEDGINFLKSYDIVVHPRCEHLVDELIHYAWAVDRQSGEILPKPADAHNHVIDALRYALEGARRAWSGSVMIRSSGRRTFANAYSSRSSFLESPGHGGGAGWGSVPSRRVGILD